MLKDAVAVVDIGMYSLTALIGENGINNNFMIRAITQVDHEAFDETSINDGKLYGALESALKKVSTSAKARLDRIYVGVPGPFLRIFNTEQRTSFNRARRVRERDISDLFDGAQKSLDTGDYEIITRSGVCYYVDGNLPCDELLGVKTSLISSYVTLYGAQKRFTGLLRDMLRNLKISEVYFIPVPLAEGQLLFSKNERKQVQILLDVGYLSSTLSILAGDGTLFHKSFNVGGGYVTAYLYDKFNVDFEVAERLKRKVNLSILKDVGNYVVVYGEGQYTFPVGVTNDVTRSILDTIAENFDKALLNSRVKLPHDAVVSLTGGGITYIRGGAEYLGGRIEMPVNIVAPKIAYMSKPEDTSSLAVLNYALNQKFY